MNNNINTSIQSRYLEQQLRKEIAQQDVYRAFVLNANSIAPQEHRAYLLKTRNPVSSFIIATADTGKDIVELGKALVTGKSNDNQLGRFNDLGMKLGGLGIASYLFTKRGTGTKGIMEFLGAGAFFATMAAWPRLLISEPLKMRFGFDIRQQYIDAQGRKKRLYLDNQFVPDLYSNEEIDKIADKMGIDKKNPEYRELTKEKMRTIALQGNTLWMLSAGFSPLLTSMICNLAERGVTKYIVNSQYNKILKQADGLEEIATRRQLEKGFNLAEAKELKHILETRVTEPDESFYRKVVSILDPFSALNNAKDVDDANLIGELGGIGPKIRKQIEQGYGALKSQEGVSGMLEIDKIIPVMKKYSSNGISDIQGNTELNDFIVKITRKLRAARGEQNKIKYITVEQFDNMFQEAIKGAKPKQIERLTKAYEETLAGQFATPEIVEKLCKTLQQIYSEQTRPISAKVATYADFINALAGQKYESLHTSIHLNSVNALMQTLKIPYDELNIARNSLDSARGILQGRFTQIASDETNYANFISDISSRQAKFEASTVDKLLSSIKEKVYKGLISAFNNVPEDSPLAVLKAQSGIDIEVLKGLIEKTFGVSYDTFIKEYGAENVTAEKLAELLKAKGADVDSLRRAPMFKRIINLFIEEKGAGIRATGHRYLLEADFERRIQTGELKNYWKYLSGEDEISEEVLKICRSIIYDSSMNDLANKFYADGNGEFAVKIIKLLFGEPGAQGEDAMRSGLSKLTYESCDKSLIQKLVATRENFYKIYAQMADFARAGHKIDGVGTQALQKTQYSMLGKSGTELFMDTASKMFNDKHWMRIFGTLTGIVIGVTLFAQFFFGKAKNEHLYKVKKENGGVNASK